VGATMSWTKLKVMGVASAPCGLVVMICFGTGIRSRIDIGIGSLPKIPPAPVFRFVEGPAVGTILVPAIVVKIVIVGVEDFGLIGGLLLLSCLLLFLLLLQQLQLPLPRTRRASPLREYGRLGDLLRGGGDGHLAEGVGTDPAVFGDGA